MAKNCDSNGDDVSVASGSGIFSLFDWNEFSEETFLFSQQEQTSGDNNSLFVNNLAVKPASSSPSHPGVNKDNNNNKNNNNIFTPTSTSTSSTTQEITAGSPCSSDSNTSKRKFPHEEEQNGQPATTTTTDTELSMKKDRREWRPQHEVDARQKQIDVMMRLPFEFQSFVNSGDLVSLRELIQRHFVPDCEFHNSNMIKPMFGNMKIFDMHQMIIETIPDGTGVVKEVRYDGKLGVIHAKMIFSGTKCFHLPPSPNPFTNQFFNLSVDDPDYELRMKFIELIKAGKRVEFCGEINWVLYLDVSLSKVQRFFIHKRIIAVQEAPPMRL